MLSIVIPTYDERGNIAPLVRKIRDASPGCEIIFVDDNSPDGTADEITRISERYANIRLLKRAGKQGLSGAVAKGVAASSSDRIIVMDADLSHPPEKIPALLAALNSADLVIGSRLMKGGGAQNWPFHRKLISDTAHLLAKLVLGVKSSDSLSGFFAIRKDIFLRTRLRTKGYKLLLNILFDNPGIKVRDVPYFFSDRKAGKTKLGMGEMARFLSDLFSIRFG